LSEVLEGRLALPFDHAQLVLQAAERLAGKALYTALPLYLLARRLLPLRAASAPAGEAPA